MEKEVEVVQSEDVVVENAEKEKLFKKSIVLRIIIPLLVGVLSFGVIGKTASDPATYKKYIETLDKKQKNVLLLSASTAGVATLISVIGGDRGQSISDKLFDITGYFLVILCAIMLEKYLAGLLGLVAFKVIVPLACLLYIVSALRRDKIIKQFAIKLCIFAISVVFVIPGSVELSNYIDDVHKISMKVENTIKDADGIKNDIEIMQKEDEESEKVQINDKNNLQEIEEIEEDELKEKKTGLAALADGAKKIFGKTTKKVAEGAKTVGGAIVTAGKVLVHGITIILSKGADFFNNVVETIAIMLVTSCVIPVVVMLIYLWLVKMFFKLDFKITINDIPRLSQAIGNKKKEITKK